MARSRNIKPGFHKNDRLAECDPLARLLFTGLWTLADRDGRGEYRPKLIKAEALPYDDCNIDELMWQLAEREFINVYEVDGRLYFEVTKFSTHQNPHVKELSRNFPASTMQARCKYGSGRWISGASPADSLLPITDSLIPDSCSLIPDTCNPKPTANAVLSGSQANADRPSESSSSSREQSKAVVVAREDRSDSIRQVYAHYRSHHPRAHPDPKQNSKEWRAIAARLAEGYTVADLCAAIDGCHKTPHNLGQNQNQQTYLGLELIVRNGDQVNRFMEASSRAGPVLSAGSQQTASAIDSLMQRKFGSSRSEPLFGGQR